MVGGGSDIDPRVGGLGPRCSEGDARAGDRAERKRSGRLGCLRRVGEDSVVKDAIAGGCVDGIVFGEHLRGTAVESHRHAADGARNRRRLLERGLEEDVDRGSGCHITSGEVMNPDGGVADAAGDGEPGIACCGRRREAGGASGTADKVDRQAILPRADGGSSNRDRLATKNAGRSGQDRPLRIGNRDGTDRIVDKPSHRHAADPGVDDVHPHVTRRGDTADIKGKRHRVGGERDRWH
jgi:hypothetical protein